MVKVKGQGHPGQKNSIFRPFRQFGETSLACSFCVWNISRTAEPIFLSFLVKLFSTVYVVVVSIIATICVHGE